MSDWAERLRENRPSDDWGWDGELNDGAAARIEKLEKVVEALERWEANPEHFWGTTPDTGSEIAAALNELRRP